MRALPALFALMVTISTRAQEVAPAAAPDDWKVHVELHIISLPEQQATALLPELRDEAKIDGAWKKLEAMMATGEAKLDAAPGGITTDGGRITLSEGEEVNYATEFELPFVIATKKEEEKTAGATKPGGQAENAGARPGQNIAYPNANWEKRRTGVDFTSRIATSADGRWLDLDLAASHTWLTSWSDTEIGRLANGEKLIVKHPQFASASVEEHLGLASGERTLLSIHHIPGNQDRMELFVLHAWTTARKKSAQ